MFRVLCGSELLLRRCRVCVFAVHDRECALTAPSDEGFSAYQLLSWYVIIGHTSFQRYKHCLAGLGVCAKSH